MADRIVPRLKKITFEEILPVWSDKLWKGRDSPINPMSSMLFLGGYDMSIYEKYDPIFIGAFQGKRLIGVNSAHATSKIHFRSRGLYVDEGFRNLGVAKKLLLATVHEGINQNMEIIWSLPRETSVPAYKSIGFKVYSSAINDLKTVEFGPNYYVSIML